MYDEIKRFIQAMNKITNIPNYYANKNMFKKLTFPHDWGWNGKKNSMTKVDANL